MSKLSRASRRQVMATGLLGVLLWVFMAIALHGHGPPGHAVPGLVSGWARTVATPAQATFGSPQVPAASIHAAAPEAAPDTECRLCAFGHAPPGLAANAHAGRDWPATALVPCVAPAPPAATAPAPALPRAPPTSLA